MTIKTHHDVGDYIVVNGLHIILIRKRERKMRVYCEKEECKWFRDYECNRGVICLDFDGQCEDFESIYEDAEWQNPYWKRMIDKESGQIYRALFYGKEIDIDGLKFFIDYNSQHAAATEWTTGLCCGSMCELRSRIEKIAGFIANHDIPPLETLPIGEYDRKTRNVKPKQTEQSADEKL